MSGAADIGPMEVRFPLWATPLGIRPEGGESGGLMGGNLGEELPSSSPGCGEFSKSIARRWNSADLEISPISALEPVAADGTPLARDATALLCCCSAHAATCASTSLTKLPGRYSRAQVGQTCVTSVHRPDATSSPIASRCGSIWFGRALYRRARAEWNGNPPPSGRWKGCAAADGPKCTWALCNPVGCAATGNDALRTCGCACAERSAAGLMDMGRGTPRACCRAELSAACGLVEAGRGAARALARSEPVLMTACP
mmetsp:Transcript_26208/g.60539  ORF Transcript_26208/g.60539 Transcript_26208/m.60539 type:complete len:257 (-) Transcript_26208:749-1519(-)